MRASRAADDSAISRIRQATAESHQRLETLVESLGMLQNLDGFARHLTLLHDHCASHQPLLRHEPELQRIVLERQQELALDLEHLGRRPPHVEVRNCAPFTRAQCFGFTYVTEGSRLGALVVAKRLSSSGVAIEKLRSLSRPPAVVREHWAAFCEQLSKLPRDEWDRAAATAVEGFALLERAHAALE